MQGRSGEQIDADIRAMRDEWEDRRQGDCASPFRQGVTLVLVYLDSNIIIYLIEQPAQFGPRASAWVAKMAATGDRIVVSDLTRLECRVNAVASGDQVILAQYDAFFSQAIERVITLTTAVVDRATIPVVSTNSKRPICSIWPLRLKQVAKFF